MSRAEIEQGLQKAGVRTAQRHLFLCLGPDCCSPSEGEETWKYMKQRVKELDLRVMRTKTLCFRICSVGPWLVVYPDGVWYAQVRASDVPEIIEEHLLNGRVVERLALMKVPCAGGVASAEVSDDGAWEA